MFKSHIIISQNSNINSSLLVDTQLHYSDILLLCCSMVKLSNSLTPWTAACQASLSLTISLSLFKLMSTELVMQSNHLILCCPLLWPSVFPSIRVFK